jgi:WD repeat-containing protein 17
LLWNTEIPYLLLSGSWDASIILWDVRRGIKLTNIAQHTSDVYGLTCNPERPFTFVSSSRDSTIRFWNFESLIEPIRLKMFISVNFDDIHNPNLEKVLEDDSNGKLSVSKVTHLYGPKSRQICKDIQSGKLSTPLEKYQAILDFLYLYDGQSEFWDMINVIKNGKIGDVFS